MMDFDQEYIQSRIMKSGNEPLDMIRDEDGTMRYFVPSGELEATGDMAAAVQEERMLPPVEVIEKRDVPVATAAKPKPQPTPVAPTQGQLDLGEAKPIQPTGAMNVLKSVGQMIQSGAEKIDFDVLGLPGIGTLTLKDLTVGDLGKVLVDIAEGFPPITGSGETLKPTTEAIELINVAPAATGAIKLGKKVLPKVAESLAPVVGEVFENYAARTGLTNYIVDTNKVFSGYSEGVPRIKPTIRLESSLKKLDSGQINEQQFIEETRYVSGKMRQSVEAGKAPKDKVRGTDEVRRRILGAKIQGDISEESADFADWLLTKNPQLGEELGIRIKGSNADGAAGQYSSLNKVATLFKGRENPGTAVHEILHHTERMMPTEIQNGILDEWNQAYSTALAKSDKQSRPYLEKMLDAINGSQGAQKIVMEGFNKGILNYDQHYQLVNPSEFWAVNATRLMQSRYDAGSWIGKAKVWVGEMAQKAKGAFGLPSDSPILRGLKEVTGGEGKFKSTEMMAQEEPVLRARMRGVEKEITAKGRKRVAKGGTALGIASQMQGEEER